MTDDASSTEGTEVADVQRMTRTEAEALLEYLRQVPEARWDTGTVCDPWSVKHLVAHLTALSNQTLPNFAKRMISTGFNFQKVVDGDLQKYLKPREEMLKKFESSIRNPTTPKMLDAVALGEFMVHGEDIRRALGDRGEHESAHVSAIGKMYAESKKPLNGRVRTKGLSLRATDGDFVWGDGPEVSGPGIDLLLAVAGRPGALDRCEGEGLATLRSRC
jgi:uncharacterized protein (TIGR03083 family)